MTKGRDVKEQVVGAFASSPYKWRTARGIAKDAGLPMGEVLKFLERSPDILKSKKANRQGQPLFTTRERYREFTPLSRRLSDALLNRTESDD